MIGDMHFPQVKPLLVRSAQLGRVADGTFPIETTDIIIFGHMPKHEDWVHSCEQNGKIVLRYANILNQPIKGWVGNPWMDWTRENMPVLRDEKGRPAIFPWFYNPEIISWGEASEELVIKAASVLKDAVQGRGYFLDQAWDTVRDWMCDPYLGATIGECVKATGMTRDEYDGRWFKNILMLFDNLDSERKTPKTFLVNGEWKLRSVAPVYLENAHKRWGEAASIWGSMPTQSVLAPDLRGNYGHVNTALKIWVWKGGYLAMDGEGADELEDHYYEQACEMREGRT